MDRAHTGTEPMYNANTSAGTIFECQYQYRTVPILVLNQSMGSVHYWYTYLTPPIYVTYKFSHFGIAAHHLFWGPITSTAVDWCARNNGHS
jgi:hypothetical protein